MANPITPDRDGSPDIGAPSPSAGPRPARSYEPTEAELRRVAISRLKKKRDFRSHLFVYLVINVAFWVGWFVDGVVNQFEFPWPVFPTVVWGLFILGHANDIYWKDPFREELVQHEIEKLRAASHIHPLDTYSLDDDDDEEDEDEDDGWC